MLARHGLSRASGGGEALPWTIAGVNVLGSFLLGLLLGADWGSPEVRTALGVGFLGGFTTFSTFSVQVVRDLEDGRPGRAVAYLAISVVVGIAAAALGLWAGRRVT